MRGFRRFDPGIALSLALAARVFARSPASDSMLVRRV
jgi:hypothetical protein